MTPFYLNEKILKTIFLKTPISISILSFKTNGDCKYTLYYLKMSKFQELLFGKVKFKDGKKVRSRCIYWLILHVWSLLRFIVCCNYIIY